MTLVNITDEMKREYVRSKLAEKFYHAHCKHKQWEPRPRIDNWAYDYADIALDYLPFDDESIKMLSGDR